MQGNKQHKVPGRKPLDDPKIIKNILLENKERIIHEGQLRPPSDRIWQEIKQKYNVLKTTKALYTFVCCNRSNLKYELGLLIKRNINEENDDEESYAEEEEDDASEEELEDNTDFMQKEQPSLSFQIHIPKEKWNAFGWNASFVVSGLSLYIFLHKNKMPLLVYVAPYICTFSYTINVLSLI